jgi:hypothetical protein
MNASVTGRMIKRKGEQLAIELNLPDSFKSSNGWLQKFQRRNNFKMHRLHGEAASVDPVVVERGRKDLQKETQLFERCDIYNMDETAVLYNMQPSTAIARAVMSGVKKDKSRISAALTSNADGSDKLPMLFIGKAIRPRCFGNMTREALGMLYRNNRKAWMTIALFSEWIDTLNSKMRASNRKILLILDNASSHKAVGVELTNVRVLMLPPNTTRNLQPMDAGIIASYKTHYRRRQVDHAIDIVDNMRDAVEGAVGKKRKNLYCVDVLQAMTWSTEAWNDVTPTTIQNCWNHTGIVPSETLMMAFDRLRIANPMSFDLVLTH